MKLQVLAIISLFFSVTIFSLQAEDTIKLKTNTLVNVDYHHGQLEPVKGVHNIQVLRANRENPDSADGFGWTYNHGPNMAYWNNTFYIQYLSNPVSEHVPPGQVFLSSSRDGYQWDKPIVAFPPYKIPDGTTKEGYEGVAKDLYSVLHQRVGFYVASNNRLITMGYFGLCLDHKDSPNDGKGIGRVVREIYEDGTMGEIYFIRYNKSWNEKNTSYPFYKSSKDKGFKKACDELLSKPLMMQQWVEEADRDDPLIPLKKQYKAFSYYHLNENKVVGLWKYALTSISNDGGITWEYNPTRAPGFVNKNAKIWGQSTSDGRYATVYNPSMFRWPLAASVSDDGLIYNNLLLINGEITTMRYAGFHKSYGPQYIRGILEGNGIPPDSAMWLTYSMNKEDIWVSKVPVPLVAEEKGNVDDVFNDLSDGKELNNWNIFSPIWAPVHIKKDNQGIKWLSLSDWDRFDYAMAERIIPSSENSSVEFTIKPAQNDNGILFIELQNAKGYPCIRLIFNEEGDFINKDGYKFDHMIDYEANKEYKVRIDFELKRNYYEVFINDKKEAARNVFAPVKSIEKVMFRTGERRYYPNADSPYTHEKDIEDTGAIDKKAEYLIKNFKVMKK